MSVRTAALILLVAMPACDSGEAPAEPDNELLVAVQKAKYAEWARAPGKEEREPTLAPHSGAVEVFINDVVERAIANEDGLGLTQWPEGSTIVLEGYAAATLEEGAPPDEPVQIAIMQKHGGTWRWEQYQAEDLGAPRFAGRPDVCVGCHVGAQDFVRGFSLPRPVVDE